MPLEAFSSDKINIKQLRIEEREKSSLREQFFHPERYFLPKLWKEQIRVAPNRGKLYSWLNRNARLQIIFPDDPAFQGLILDNNDRRFFDQELREQPTGETFAQLAVALKQVANYKPPIVEQKYPWLKKRLLDYKKNGHWIGFLNLVGLCKRLDPEKWSQEIIISDEEWQKISASSGMVVSFNANARVVAGERPYLVHQAVFERVLGNVKNYLRRNLNFDDLLLHFVDAKIAAAERVEFVNGKMVLIPPARAIEKPDQKGKPARKKF